MLNITIISTTLSSAWILSTSQDQHKTWNPSLWIQPYFAFIQQIFSHSFPIHATNILHSISQACLQNNKTTRTMKKRVAYRLSDADHNFLAFVGSVVDQTGDFLFLAFVFLQQTLGLGEFRREVSLHVFLLCSLNQAIKLSRTKHSSSQYRSMISRIIANLEKTKDSLSGY